MHNRPQFSKRRSKRGFALVIALSLMAFIVLLLLSLTSMLSIQVKGVESSKHLTAAKENAFYGMQVAVAQLQRYAGPDKRVTARADITSPDPLLQPYLTGVWSTDNLTATPDTWLISGNEIDPLATTPTTAPDPAVGNANVIPGNPESVFLLGSNSVWDPTQRVALPKQPINMNSGSGSSGHYAWWVGDSGVKVSASLVNPLLDANAIAYDNTDQTGGANLGDDWSDEVKRARLDMMNLARPQLEHAFPTLDPDDADYDEMSKIMSWNHLLLVTNAPLREEVDGHYHDFTPLSRGVYLDIANGRLKKDLSDTTPSVDPYVATIQQFLSARATPVDDSGLPADKYKAYIMPLAPTDATADEFPIFSIGPVMSGLGIRIGFFLQDGSVHYRYSVSAQFWNPYNCEMRLDSSEPLVLEISGLPTFTLTSDTGSTTDFSFDVPPLTVDANTVWEPGQFINLLGTSGSLLPSSSAELPFEGQVPGSWTDMSATSVTITYDGTSDFSGTLLVDGDPLATYTPYKKTNSHSFKGATYNGLTPPTWDYSTTDIWTLGYGFEFFADLRLTTSNGNPSSTISEAFDPRKPNMEGKYYEEPSKIAGQEQKAFWARNNVSLNRMENEADTFPHSTYGSAVRIVLFDLPRQEVISTGLLTHIIGDQSYGIGNPWGGANNAIFDEYFISTIPRYSADWAPGSGLPLPNRYIEVFQPNNGQPTIEELRDGEHAARYLLQKGTFNINSTSIEAWKALLGGKFDDWEHTFNVTSGSVDTKDLDNVFFRMPHGAQQLTTPPVMTSGVGSSGFNNTYASKTSGRQLTNDEIDRLAALIVEKIRVQTRPFVSLQEFIESGVLDTAITESAINEPDPSTKPGLSQTRRYSPGAVTQADIISAIAPLLSARSDTFVIRSYGDVEDPLTGRVQARAWCEAVVQRTPDLVENPDAPLADVVAPDEATYPFGRKFEIISFRWLSESEI